METIFDKVESLEADPGIACFERELTPANLYHEELFETKLKVIAPRGHFYWSQDEIALEDISKASFIAFPPTAAITRLLEKKLSERGLKLNVILTLNNFEIVKKYVENGMGISILDDFTLTEDDQTKFDIRSLDLFFSARYYSILLRKRKYLSPAV